MHVHADTGATGLRAAMILFLTNGALFGVWVVRIADIKLALGLGEGELGLVLLAAAAGAVSTFGLAARAADRFGAGRVTLCFALAMATILPFLALAPSAITLAATLFLFGAAGGSMDLVMNAYATEVEKRARRSRMALLHGCWSIGLASSAGIAALGIARLPTFAHFAGGALLGALAIALAAYLIVAAGPQPRGEGRRAPLIALPHGALIPVAAMTALAFMTEGAGMEWGGVHVRETLGGTVEQGAMALLVLAGGVMVLRLAGDPLIERLGAARALHLCAATLIVGALVAGLAPGPVIALTGLGLMGLGLSLMAPICFSRAGQLARSGSGEAVAAVSLTGYGGVLLGPVTMGLSGELLGLGTSFALLALSGVVLLVLARRVA